MNRTPIRSRSKRPRRNDGEFDDAVRATVLYRSGGRCEVGAPGCRTKATIMHHRQLRRGGDGSAANALHLCAPCHTHVHANVAESRDHGWIVSQWADPSIVTWDRWAK